MITGGSGRRVWSADAKAAILEEALVPGAVVSAVARRHGVTSQQVFGWRREARRALEAGQDPTPMTFVPAMIRPLALTRKNALFAGLDGGGQHWAVIASLVETCKLNGMEPHAYLSDVFTLIAEGHPNRRLDELLPWAYASEQDLEAVAWRLRLRSTC
ncbi:transposase domain-containing protein [Methylobacterium nonmethylotrophicum]|uniref:transposase domain-containing protein n=1 Tax=Methylobacterium nonmethylotrophicum TaxID=1141884 RepID=UPI003CCB71D8